MSLRKSWQRYLRAQASTDLPDLRGPLLEVYVVGYAAIEGDGIVLGAARRLAAGTRVATFAMLHDFGGALETPRLC